MMGRVIHDFLKLSTFHCDQKVGNFSLETSIQKSSGLGTAQSCFHPEPDSSELQKVHEAIGRLVQVGFLVKTGAAGEVLFLSEPAMAHTIGAVITNPGKFEGGAQFAESFGQQTLSLLENN